MRRSTVSAVLGVGLVTPDSARLDYLVEGDQVVKQRVEPYAGGTRLSRHRARPPEGTGELATGASSPPKDPTGARPGRR